MSIIFKYTLFNLQGHIRLLQGHKVCTRTRYFNACPGGSTIQSLHGFRTAQNCFEFVLSLKRFAGGMFAFSYFAVGSQQETFPCMHVTILTD